MAKAAREGLWPLSNRVPSLVCTRAHVLIHINHLTSEATEDPESCFNTKIRQCYSAFKIYPAATQQMEACEEV